jgi:SNF2 family DNA or RNA helicase
VVICKLTPLQTDLYKLFVKSNIDGLDDETTTSSSGVGKDTLSAITAMKKLCNRKFFSFHMDLN